MSNYVQSQNSSIMIGQNQVHIWLPWNIRPPVGVCRIWHAFWMSGWLLFRPWRLNVTIERSGGKTGSSQKWLVMSFQRVGSTTITYFRVNIEEGEIRECKNTLLNIPWVDKRHRPFVQNLLQHNNKHNVAWGVVQKSSTKDKMRNMRIPGGA